MSARRGDLARVFAIPLLLAALTTLGLLAALLIEPLGRYVAWLTLGLPIVVVAWSWRRK
jgi:hypothetical protein